MTVTKAHLDIMKDNLLAVYREKWARIITIEHARELEEAYDVRKSHQERGALQRRYT